MKRFLLILLFVTVVACLAATGVFVYRNGRGVGPAISKPPEDIAALLAEAKVNQPVTSTVLLEDKKTSPLHLPPGFSIAVFAKGLVQPRVLAWDPSGTLLVSVPKVGNVLALVDANHDGVADTIKTVIKGLNKPHGIVFRGNELYIAETNRVAEYTYDAVEKKATFVKKLIDLPTDGYNQHYTRTLLLNPKDTNQLLVSVGSSCNVCHETDARRAKILAVDVANGTVTDFARGLRNSVFMAAHPVSQQVWATEMGRDLLGDDIPPDEVNIIEPDSQTGEAKNYGWPICYGNNIHDTAFDHNTYIRNPCMAPFEQPSLIDLPAHSAPLGLAFVPAKGVQQWPQEYRGDLLIAYHGSWNRSVPDGYKIVRYSFDDVSGTTASAEMPFIDGWLTKDNKALGRPVDLLFGADGALYISDDKAGLVYVVTPQAAR